MLHCIPQSRKQKAGCSVDQPSPSLPAPQTHQACPHMDRTCHAVRPQTFLLLKFTGRKSRGTYKARSLLVGRFMCKPDLWTTLEPPLMYIHTLDFTEQGKGQENRSIFWNSKSFRFLAEKPKHQGWKKGYAMNETILIFKWIKKKVVSSQLG